MTSLAKQLALGNSTLGVLEFQVGYHPCLVFMWVLELPTLVLILAQCAFYWVTHFHSPLQMLLSQTGHADVDVCFRVPLWTSIASCLFQLICQKLQHDQFQLFLLTAVVQLESCYEETLPLTCWLASSIVNIEQGKCFVSLFVWKSEDSVRSWALFEKRPLLYGCTCRLAGPQTSGDAPVCLPSPCKSAVITDVPSCIWLNVGSGGLSAHTCVANVLSLGHFPNTLGPYE